MYCVVVSYMSVAPSSAKGLHRLYTWESFFQGLRWPMSPIINLQRWLWKVFLIFFLSNWPSPKREILCILFACFCGVCFVLFCFCVTLGGSAQAHLAGFRRYYVCCVGDETGLAMWKQVFHPLHYHSGLQTASIFVFVLWPYLEVAQGLLYTWLWI